VINLFSPFYSGNPGGVWTSLPNWDACTTFFVLGDKKGNYILDFQVSKMALHEQCVGKTDEWYTPPRLFTALGCSFDLDVASPGPSVVPWIPAHRYIDREDDGLKEDWQGFVWMNPPFGARNGLLPWLNKFVAHRNGVCLVPDRTSAPWWQLSAPDMDLILFVSGKIKFIGADGKPGNSPAQGTCLMALGSRGKEALHRAAANGLGLVCVPERADRRSCI
jgi:hypothetical protein